MEVCMKIGEAYGSRIRELLYKKHMSSYRLMRLTGINMNTIADLINLKKQDVKSSTIQAILSTIGVSWKEFIDSPLFDPENLD